MIPPPPAQVQEAPDVRGITFPGFNGLPLGGTVTAAKGGTLFAVMVGDSGPLDRDGSEPRLPVHGYRILAQWLKAQGIGSLRYDKRIAFSKDPKLNVSLDAQAGDVKAALAAARALPEARGRRILLVGHGEGALLAFMAAQEADALLLLAMPGQSMATALTDRMSGQLPASIAAPNLAYFRSVLQAIRAGSPCPQAGKDVHPAVARFCASLMAPETLAYVRETLDLDPWVLASHVGSPMAVVWGGKDVQAWKPARIPETFKGTILEIPGANHLLRQEPRPRADLEGAAALEGYQDDRPLADLSPVAEWLRSLK